MSREFHWTDACYAYQFLADAEGARPVTGEPIADAIRDMLMALAPVEYAVAGLQEGDSGKNLLIERSIENAASIRSACMALMRAVDAHTTPDSVMLVLDDMLTVVGRCGSHYYPHVAAFADAQLERLDLDAEVLSKAQAVRARVSVAMEMARERTGFITGAEIDAEIARRRQSGMDAAGLMG